MNITIYKQNVKSAKTTSVNISGMVKVVVGKKMSTGLIQVAIYQGLQGPMIAKGYMSINTFFNVAHMGNTKMVFNKKTFKNLL